MTSTISGLGGSVICGDENDEDMVTMIADGTAKAGWLVGNSSGTIAGTDTDGVDTFVGILKERYDTDLDSIPTAGKPVTVVRPRSGHRYRVFVTDLNASGPGLPLQFGATAGSLSVVAAVEGAKVAYTTKYTDNDTVAEITWA
jgi:hypothetical protein